MKPTKPKEHQHKWKFMEHLPAHPLWRIKEVNDVWDMEKEYIGWTKTFACVCGQAKRVVVQKEFKK